MKQRTAFIVVLVSLLPIAQSLMIVTVAALTSAAVILAIPEKTQAETAEFYFNRAYDKGESGDSSGAIIDYTKAIRIEPNNIDLYIFRAIAYELSHQDQLAYKDYKFAHFLNPNCGIARHMINYLQKKLEN